MPHGKIGRGASYDIADRLGEHDAIDAECVWQGNRKGNYDDDLPEEREEDCLLRPSQRDECLLARCLQRHEHEGEEIDAERMGRRIDHHGILGEEHGHRMGEGEHDDPDDERIHEYEEQHEVACLHDASAITGAIVIAHDRA